MQGGGLAVASKVMSFAKQRFDSDASPQQQFCCMVVAIAILLAYAASDTRVKNTVRARAERRLRELPGHILTAGLSASYSEEALRFLRLFDVADHDPALTWREKRDFDTRMRSLFVQGFIFCDPGEGATCLQIVTEQAHSAPPIYYQDGKVLHLHRKPSHDEAQRLAQSMHAVTEASLKRVDAELHDDQLSILFTALDLHRWFSAIKADREGSPDRMAVLRRHARRLVSHLGFNVDVGVRELESVAYVLCRQEATRLEGGVPCDNRAAWGRVTTKSFATQHATSGAYSVLPDLVSVYISCMDGTGGIERSLGVLARILDAHVGPLIEDGKTASDLYEVLADGPAQESDLASPPIVMVGGKAVAAPGNYFEDHAAHLTATDFTRKCALMWVKMHGRRFSIYSTTRKPGPRAKARAGTMVSVARASAKASDRLVKMSQTAGHSMEETTILGLKRKHVAQKPGQRGKDNPAWNSALQKFDDLTTKNCLECNT